MFLVFVFGFGSWFLILGFSFYICLPNSNQFYTCLGGGFFFPENIA
jgi:hypothetical protein